MTVECSSKRRPSKSVNVDFEKPERKFTLSKRVKVTGTSAVILAQHLKSLSSPCQLRTGLMADDFLELLALGGDGLEGGSGLAAQDL